MESLDRCTSLSAAMRVVLGLSVYLPQVFCTQPSNRLWYTLVTNLPNPMLGHSGEAQCALVEETPGMP